eukprot:4565570-Prymnesium_polylepis.3
MNADLTPFCDLKPENVQPSSVHLEEDSLIERHDVGEPRVCDDDANVDPEPEQPIALGGDRVDGTVRAGVRSTGNDGTGQGG